MEYEEILHAVNKPVLNHVVLMIGGRINGTFTRPAAFP